MKFNKHRWKRDEPTQILSRDSVESKIRQFYPGANLEEFSILSSGLVNTNIHFKISGLNDSFLLRIYCRDNQLLNIESALSQRFGSIIPMPEFLFVQKKDLPEQSFAIQKWFRGVHFYKILETATEANLMRCADNIANTLSKISTQTFSSSGFFKENLDIIPFDKVNEDHPFILYIKDCLFKGQAGIHLGQELRDKLWNYVIKNQDFFPEQEPACLVHGDFNFDNILIDPDSYKVMAILDWEFAFPGSYLFDIGTFLRFELPQTVKDEFISSYQRYSEINLPSNFEKMIKVQDLANFVGLINHAQEDFERTRDVKSLINETLIQYP